VLDKRYQQADWSRRPLPGGMLDYAAMDTSLLIPLYHQLREELSARGRLAWVLEECRLLSAVRMADRSAEPLSARAKGAARLSRGALARLEALLRFREQEAERRDLPPFKILGNETLLTLAERDAAAPADLAGVPGLTDKLVARYGQGLLESLQRGKELDPEALPQFNRQRRPERSRQQEERLKKLKTWRAGRAAELGLEPGLLANNALLEALVDLPPGTPVDLKSWQRELFGPEVWRLAGRPGAAEN
jgi:ribonuclease D